MNGTRARVAALKVAHSSSPLVWQVAALGLLLPLLGLPRLCWADQGLRRAEAAYGEVDFENTIRHAEAALAGGQLNPRQLARAYELLGISATALDRRDAARRYFIRLLAIDPSAQRLEGDLSPSQRDTLMEARGFWASHRTRLNVEVDLIAQRGSLRIRLTDPADMVQTVEVQARVVGAVSFNRSTIDDSAVSYVEVEGADDEPRVEYTLALLDEHGNRLLQLGDDDVPETVGTEATQTAAGGSGQGTAAAPATPRSRTWIWVVLGVAAAAVVGGGVATGVVLYQQSQTVSAQSGVVFSL